MSKQGLTCIILSVLNVKLDPEEQAFFGIFGFHGLPPVNLSNIYFKGLRSKATMSYGIDVLCFVLFCFSFNSKGPKKKNMSTR
jgi:hypothetical protein